MPLRPYTTQSQILVIRTFVVALAKRGLLSASTIEAFPRFRKVPVMPQFTLEHAEVRKLLRGMSSHEPSLFMIQTI
jgi:hypothetical protein